MKHLLMTLFLCILILSFNSRDANSADILYDNFDAPYLDGEKWWPREYVREVVDGKLVSKLGNSSGMGAEVAPGVFRNNLPIANPDSVHTIESEVTIVEARLDTATDSKSFARICGYFYNKNESGGATGDIFAMLMIGDRGNGGLEAFWEVQEMLTDDTRTWTVIGSDTIIGPGVLQYDVPYELKLSYSVSTGGDNIFSFTAHGATVNFTGPVKEREAVTLYKSISTAIDAENGSNDGFIHAEFDNVHINNDTTSVYDDFSSSLDLLKWEWLEKVREISDGSLKANVQAENTNNAIVTYLSHSDTNFVEAKVRLSNQSIQSPGAFGVARIAGLYYNDSRGPGSGLPFNGYEGNVFVQIGLAIDGDGSLYGRFVLHRADDADATSWTLLFHKSFTTPIDFNENYIMSIRFLDNQLIFKCDNETLFYNITTHKYFPYSGYRLLQTKFFLDPGESGYLKAFFDDVQVSEDSVNFCLQDYDFDTDMDGKDVVAFVQDAKDVLIEDFAEHFGRTDCP